MRISPHLRMWAIVGMFIWGTSSRISAQTAIDSPTSNSELLTPRLVAELGADQQSVGERAQSVAEAHHGVTGRTSTATKLTFSPDGRLLATASRDRNITVWEVKTGRLLHKVQAQFFGFGGDLRFSPDGWLLGMSGQQGSYRLWQVSTGELLAEYGPIPNLSTSSESRFSPELDRLAVGSRDGRVHLVETSTGKQISALRVFDEHQTGAMAFSEDGRFLAVGAYRSRNDKIPRGALVIWDLVNNKKARELTSPDPENGRFSSEIYEALEFSPDGGTLASRHSELGLELWRSFEGTRIERVPNQASRLMAFSRIGQILVLLSSPGIQNPQLPLSQVRLIECATGQVFQTWNVPNQTLAFAMSPDGQLLAVSLTNSRRILLYDVAPPLSGSPPTEDELRKAVEQLARQDARRGRNAMATLVSGGDRSLPLLAAHLNGVDQPGQDEEQIQRLIRDLDHDDFFRREQASQDLAGLGTIAVPALAAALEKNPALEVATRIRALLKHAKKSGTKISGESLRGIRAIEILERIKSGKALKLLHSLAKGAETSPVANEAMFALKRIQRLRFDE